MYALNRKQKLIKKNKLAQSIGTIIKLAFVVETFNPLFVFAMEEELALETVNVTAKKESDTRPINGYNAKKSTTATKTDTPLIDVPQSITVITQEVMQDLSVQSLANAVQYVPGIQSAQGEGNRDALIFRGNLTTGDMFVDGVRDDIQTYRDIYNTERLEVLKGPNGMIFGRGGAGGAINRVSKEAGWDPVREVKATLGMFDQKRISADVGQGLSDEIAFRLNAVYENSDSYRDGVWLERYGVTPTFTFKPSDKTKLTFSAEYFKDKRIADRGVPSLTSGTGTNANLGNRPFRIGDYDTFFGSAKLSPTETETGAFNAYFEHIFENGITLKNRTRYADYDKYYQNVYARGPVSLAGTVQLGAYRDETERENLFNQTDITYTLNWGSIEHKLLAGAEFGKQKTDNSRLTPIANTENLPGVFSAEDPVTRANLPFNNFTRKQNSDINVSAFYLQDQIKLNQYWQAIVGLRHDRFETDYKNQLNNSRIQVNDDFLSPRAGLIFKPQDNVSLYGNYSVSYVPRAGDQLISLTVVNSSFKPEKFINHEIGAKWDVLSNLSLTAAVYRLQRENVQIADPTNPALQTVVDGQETRGFELGISGEINDRWSMFGGLAVQDGEITKQQGSGNSAILKGAELAQTPDRTFSLWNKYKINDIWAIGLGVVSRSEMFAATPTATQSTILPGYTRYDAAIFANFTKELSMQVNIENLTDKEYALFAHNNNNITPGAPINARATLIYNF